MLVTGMALFRFLIRETLELILNRVCHLLHFGYEEKGTRGLKA